MDDILSSFHRDIESFVDEYLTAYPVSKVKDGRKVIHDALWGTQHLNAHELAILDTPLIQRLRRIKQTSFAYLIYPSATHSRFEHTIGVLFQIEKLLNALSQGYPDLIDGYREAIRMAALLHDCGHGPFSHSSEEIYKFLPDMDALIGPGGPHEGVNAHEILGYYIITSEAFKKQFDSIITQYDKAISIDQIAKLIAGITVDPASKYLTDMINGPFDADKLDYLYRDGHFSGLPLKIDLDRLWYSLQILPVKRDPKPTVRTLVMSINGITPLEQILFSKMVLFTSLYQHHKVRACDCMLKAIYEYAIENRKTICGKKLERATDFLWITDDTLYAEAERNDKTSHFHKLIHNLKFRRLLKRALVFSRTTVEDESTDFFDYTNIKKFSADIKSKDPDLRKLAREIWELASKPCPLNEVWIDIPKLPPIGSADDTYINRGTRGTPDLVKLSKIFMVDDWAQTYTEHNWRGHVFCSDNSDVRKKISKAAIEVFEKRFSIKFNSSAMKLCKIDD